MAHLYLGEGTGEPRPPLRDGSGHPNIPHTADSIALSSQRDCRARFRPGSKAGFSPGWLGSATEGRRPQVRGVRSGGSLALPARPQPPTIALSSQRDCRAKFWSKARQGPRP
jgi:hypothetical protein